MEHNTREAQLRLLIALKAPTQQQQQHLADTRKTSGKHHLRKLQQEYRKSLSAVEGSLVRLSTTGWLDDVTRTCLASGDRRCGSAAVQRRHECQPSGPPRSSAHITIRLVKTTTPSRRHQWLQSQANTGTRIDRIDGITSR